MEPITIAIIMAVYFIASFYGSMVGGAALLTIPTLIFAGLSPHVAIGTNKIGSFGNSSGASLGYGLERKIDYKFGFVFMVFVVIGAVIGTISVLSVPEYLIKKLIGIFMIIIAVFLFFKNNFGTKVKEAKNDIFKEKKYILILILFALGSGFYNGFYGAGIGIINRFVLSAVFAYAIINSAALSTFANIASNIFSLAVFTYFGAVQYSLFIPIILASVIGAFLGAKYSVRIGDINVKRLLSVASIIMAIKLLFF